MDIVNDATLVCLFSILYSVLVTLQASWIVVAVIDGIELKMNERFFLQKQVTGLFNCTTVIHCEWKDTSSYKTRLLNVAFVSALHSMLKQTWWWYIYLNDNSFYMSGLWLRSCCHRAVLVELAVNTRFTWVIEWSMFHCSIYLEDVTFI